MWNRELSQVASALRPTCYPSKTTKNPYEFLGRETVETQRGCEVLCDADSKVFLGQNRLSMDPRSNVRGVDNLPNSVIIRMFSFELLLSSLSSRRESIILSEEIINFLKTLKSYYCNAFQCAGFAFKDLGFNSSCVMLKNRTKENQVCSAPSTMFLKTLNCDGKGISFFGFLFHVLVD